LVDGTLGDVFGDVGLGTVLGRQALAFHQALTLHQARSA
jgi:hypothetical protein